MIKKLTTYLNFLFISSRPTTWLRIFAEILIGFAAGKGSLNADYSKFIITFFTVGPLLWTAAYILNDISDVYLDKQHIFRKTRPLSSGTFSTNQAFITAIFLIIFNFYISIRSDFSLTLILLLLLCSQLLYTLKPFRFKILFPFDLLLNGFNGALRFTAGYLASGQKFYNFPVYLLLFSVSVKLLLFLGHRLQNRELEVRNKFRSTIALLKLSQIKYLGIFLILLITFFYGLTIIFYKNTFKMLLPPSIAILMTVPILFNLRKGYLVSEEKNIKMRVYLYFILFIFSVVFYLVYLDFV